ncbi:recombination protein RecT [Paenibacillus sp. V4I3]|uniref:recombination protein RecT n=1 Tax=Paenibacillus sp. V4I3 TaxID=3042305 RepID=UPI00278627CD|nr:recombination protein RecT [Paenibacillus sp. V4I3]MDQ0873765.1 recombination protein RecT [Paenibacillus sp. V4I3]
MTTQIDQSSISNKLSNKANEATGQGKTIAQLFDDMKPAIAQAIPKHMTPDRLLRIATTAIKTTPKLKACTAESLLASVMQCAQLGLEPGVLGHAYLIPYNNKKKDANGKEYWVQEAQFQIGYKGLLDLVRRTGEIMSISAHAVHKNDKFEVEYGINEKLSHIPDFEGDRGEVTKYYAYAKFKDGGYSFLVMGKKDIERHRDMYSKTAKFGPWVDQFDEMAKKTVIKALVKYMPISIELQSKVAMDETIKTEIAPDMGEIIDITDHTSGYPEDLQSELDNAII